MKFAFEIAPRHSARLIEQARRQEVAVEVHPRTWDDDRLLIGKLTDSTAEGLRIELAAEPPPDLLALLGTHCEARFSLNDNRYLFGTTVLDANPEPHVGWIDLAAPGQLLVAERRKFWRTPLAQATEVRIHLGSGPDSASVRALLCNLSPRGLACSVTGSDIDALLIGEPVYLEFELPQSDNVYRLPGTVCNKTPAGSEDKYIVGLQFASVDEVPESRQAIDSIKKVLYTNQAKPRKARLDP